MTIEVLQDTFLCIVETCSQMLYAQNDAIFVIICINKVNAVYCFMASDPINLQVPNRSML